VEAQLEERIARLKDEEELAELTVAVAALSKKMRIIGRRNTATTRTSWRRFNWSYPN